MAVAVAVTFQPDPGRLLDFLPGNCVFQETF